MKFNEKLLGIIILCLLVVIIFEQKKVIEHSVRSQVAVTQSFAALASSLSTTEERFAKVSAAQHKELVANLEEFKPTQTSEAVPPVESRLAMRVTYNNGEQIELKNARLVSNGKSGESLSLRPDSFAFWLQIPWTNISKVTVRKSGTDTRPMGIVTLKDGTTNEYLIHSSEVRGNTGLGQIQIAIPDVREIVNITEPDKR